MSRNTVSGHRVFHNDPVNIVSDGYSDVILELKS